MPAKSALTVLGSKTKNADTREGAPCARCVTVNEDLNETYEFTPAPRVSPVRNPMEAFRSIDPEDIETLNEVYKNKMGDRRDGFEIARDQDEDEGDDYANEDLDEGEAGDSESAWLQDLQEFLFDFLSKFLDEDLAAKLLTPDAMAVWARAFTHETFDKDFNYEELEIIGDRMYEAAFPLYLYERFGKEHKLTAQLLTELKNLYMAKMHQGARSTKYGFPDYLRIPADVEKNISTREDLYESFGGGLFMTGEMVDSSETGRSSGIGFNLVREFLRWDMDKEEIDVAGNQMNSVTFVQQSLHQIGAFFKNEDIESFRPDAEGSNSGVFTIRLPEGVSRLIQVRYGIVLPLMIGSARADTRNVARKAAYERAYRLLLERGITPEFVKQARQQIIVDRLEPGMVKAAHQKAKSLGFDEIEFKILRGASRQGKARAALLGISRSGGKEVQKILASENGTEADAPRLALESFVSYDWREPESVKWKWVRPSGA